MRIKIPALALRFKQFRLALCAALTAFVMPSVRTVYLGIAASMFAVCSSSYGQIASVDADSFAVGTVLTNAFPGVTLSVVASSNVPPGPYVVISATGFNDFTQTNVATTGTLVFGNSPDAPFPAAKGWEADRVFRADFANPTNWVSIDLIADDDDSGELRAFSASGELLGTVNTGVMTNNFFRATITRPTADIAYITAAGIGGETMFLDNLQYTRAADTPSWLNVNDLFFSFQGSIAPGDIDRVVPSEHPILGGLEPGREWFAWVTVGAPGAVLSSWQAYSPPPQDLFSGPIGVADQWYANGPFNLALSGLVQSDGGIYICISQTGDNDCNRTGGFGRSNNYTFNLALAPILDTTPPVFSPPLANLVVDATSPAGAVVTYTATAKDNSDPNPTVSCIPKSGLTFKIGTTTVSCTATDKTGNSSTGSFTVTVNGAAEQLSKLIATVGLYANPWANSLDSKLQNAMDALNAINEGSASRACNSLSAFINEAKAQSGKKLMPDATQLIASANQIRDVLGCP